MLQGHFHSFLFVCLFVFNAITAKLTYIWPNISNIVQQHIMELSIQYIKPNYFPIVLAIGFSQMHHYQI
jgi:hypothetical protein